MDKAEEFEKSTSAIGRLDAVVKAGTVGTGNVSSTINVTETQEQRARKKKKVIINTSIRIDKELKDQAMALAAVKQMSFTQLIELGLKNLLRRNADLMNKFTKYNIESNEE